MTTTRRELITNAYNKLIKDIEPYDILPKLDDDFDLVELLYFFNIYFGQCKDNFEAPLKYLIKSKNLSIDEETFNKLYPSIHSFLIFFKSLT